MVWWSKFDENTWARDHKPPNREDETVKTDFEHFCDPSIVIKKKSILRLSSLIVTLGRTTKTAVDLKNLIEAGMNIARLRFSHISREENVSLIKNLKRAVEMCCEKHNLTNWPVAIAINLKSCIIRTGILKEEITYPSIYLEEGTELTVTCDVNKYSCCDYSLIFVDYPYLTKDIKIGTEVIIDIGEIILTCVEIIDKVSIRCKVFKGGLLGSMKYVSLRGVAHSAPNLSQKDINIIEFAKEYDLDFLLVPYVRNAETLLEIKKLLGNKRRHIKVLAKICTQQCLDNLEAIVEEADGIILAREFLCFELMADRIAMVQKMVAAYCKKASKPMIVSGNVLESLLVKKKLTCSDVSDVTNAILDGVDGFMIKDMATNIANMLVTIVTLSQMCKANENIVFTKYEFWRLYLEKLMPINAADACAMSCVLSARTCGAAAIVLVTVSGKTAQIIASLRPQCPVLVVATKEKVARMLHLYRGILPLFIQEKKNRNWNKEISNRIKFALDFGVNRGFLKYGEPIVVIFRKTPGSSFCDCVQIIEVTSQQLMLWKCDD